MQGRLRSGSIDLSAHIRDLHFCAIFKRGKIYQPFRAWGPPSPLGWRLCTVIRAVTSVLLVKETTMQSIFSFGASIRHSRGPHRQAVLASGLPRSPTTMFQDRMDVDVGSLSAIYRRASSIEWYSISLAPTGDSSQKMHWICSPRPAPCTLDSNFLIWSGEGIWISELSGGGVCLSLMPHQETS